MLPHLATNLDSKSCSWRHNPFYLFRVSVSEAGLGLDSLRGVGSKLRSLLPKLRRKYEVNESDWLVIKGRALLKWLDTDGRSYLRIINSHVVATVRWANRETLAARRSFWIKWPALRADILFSLGRLRLTLKWRRVPRVWEILFIERMKAAERIGIPFNEILDETLPRVVGYDPSHVLKVWVGRRSRSDPETFVRSMAKIFGRSSKMVVLGVFDRLDEGKMLADKIPEEPKYMSLVEAINRADDREAMIAEMRETRATAIVLRQETRKV